MPLDTHIIRVGRCLKLTRYISPGWAMARDITASLRRLDPDDPVKYDFAMCHLGMMKACGFGMRAGQRPVSAARSVPSTPERRAGARMTARIRRDSDSKNASGPRPLVQLLAFVRDYRLAMRSASAACRRERAVVHAAVCETMRSTVKRSFTRANPASAIAFLRGSSRSIRTIARASAGASRGGTSIPLTPSSTISGMPPLRVATIGVLQPMASRSEVPRPSVTELIANTSNP